MTASLKKSHEAAKKRLLNVPSELPTEPGISSAIHGFLTAKEDSEAFDEFLRMRQREDRRTARRESKQRGLEYVNETVNYKPDDDNEFFIDFPEDKDVDGLEDIKLDSLK